MFPVDALSIHHELSGPSSVDFVTGSTPKSILGISIQQSGTASTTNILCGSTIIGINYGKDFPYNSTQFICSDTIRASKTGQDSSSIIITYVNRDITKTEASVSASLAPISAQALSDSMQLSFISTILFLFVCGIYIMRSLFTR
jgi:hypothetical protein